MVEGREEAREREREVKEKGMMKWGSCKEHGQSSFFILHHSQWEKPQRQSDSAEREGREGVEKRVTQPVVLIWTHHTLTREVDYSNAVLTSTYEIKLKFFFFPICFFLSTCNYTYIKNRTGHIYKGAVDSFFFVKRRSSPLPLQKWENFTMQSCKYQDAGCNKSKA